MKLILAHLLLSLASAAPTLTGLDTQTKTTSLPKPICGAYVPIHDAYGKHPYKAIVEKDLILLEKSCAGKCYMEERCES